MTSATLATVDELFAYKASGFELPPFPGYTTDQWGIKAHNRPWIAHTAEWQPGQRVIEVGGAYSRLPEWLGREFNVEPWIGDDFGMGDDDGEEEMWSRWGDPRELPSRFPTVKYVLENLGRYSPKFPDRHFDCIFSVSTLEHVPSTARLDVLKDMNRCTAPGGRQLHSIDIGIPSTAKLLAAIGAEKAHLHRLLARGYPSGIAAWIEEFRRSGVAIRTPIPSSVQLLDRRNLVESPDVIYRFTPPNDTPKPYWGVASLLLVIDDV